MTRRSSTDLIPRREIPGVFRRETGGAKNPHEATIRRWYTKGCKGVVLSVTYVGGQVFTTRLAVREFIRATTEVGLRKHRQAQARAMGRPVFDRIAAQRATAELLAELGEK